MMKSRNPSIARPKLMAAAISAILFPSLAVYLFWAANLTVNMTSSMPIGIWSVKDIDPDQSIPRGSVVIFCPPDTKIFQKAKAEGILHDGSCAGSYTPLMKQVLGLPGDVIEYVGKFSVNGLEVPNSELLALGFSEFVSSETRRFVVPNGKVWLMSSYSRRSFDGRYFGFVATSDILGRARPWLVENF